MKRTLPILVLIAALAPPLLAGKPVYHCELTGLVSLSCLCSTQETASGGCCIGDQARALLASDSGGLCADCLCCEVQLYPALMAPLPSKTDLSLERAPAPLPAVLPATTTLVVGHGVRGDARTAFHAPAHGDPPLYCLHSTYLI